ncbi:DUF4349 domain-containing protein [Neobacillus niacini]|uniref:DUF4349 domain-containing protein n=1 Tax=Neobacillus niacini TaxID=86668 RepID=UPI0021CB29E2|nr:DUF4349 domain-containing protein [Neobacillus niacini]MCM3768668.1 DUF4349 domain-containing protein [Neobacillus niacini]
MKKLFILVIFLLFVGMAGCSNAGSSKDESAKMSVENKAVMDSSSSGGPEKSALTNREGDQSKPDKTVTVQVQNKMVIYQANLELRVKKFAQTVRNLEEKVSQYGGYIAESDVTREGKELLNGRLTIRLPQQHFQEFLHDAEGQAAEVLQRNITGQDVTEEYVDLESRLKSKRVVEERLLSFMKEAAKTEDLLKISADLAAIQEEIETIEGKMKFLENQTSFSTVTITLYENKVVVPDIDKDQLNTWEKTKKQFMKSTNLLLSFFSGLVVFTIGNLPILIIFIILAVLGFIIYKKRMGRQRQE